MPCLTQLPFFLAQVPGKHSAPNHTDYLVKRVSLSTGGLLVQASHCHVLPQIPNPSPDLDVAQSSPDLIYPFGHSFTLLVAWSVFQYIYPLLISSSSIFHCAFSWRTKSTLNLGLQIDKSLPSRVFETLLVREEHTSMGS